MAHIIFWEKPGCSGNRKQKEILEASGHTLEVRDLLAENWSAARLREFFGTRPVGEWFNPTHPQIKSGRFNPESIAPAEALDLMIRQPLYIVRPLLQVGGDCLAGFDVAQVHNWIGLKLDVVGERDPQNCPCVDSEGQVG